MLVTEKQPSRCDDLARLLRGFRSEKRGTHVLQRQLTVNFISGFRGIGQVSELEGFRADRASALYGFIWTTGVAVREDELESFAGNLRSEFPTSPRRLRQAIASNLRYLRSQGLLHLEESRNEILAASAVSIPIGFSANAGLDIQGFFWGVEAARRSGLVAVLPLPTLTTTLEALSEKGGG